MDRYECMDCLGLVEYVKQEPPPEPDVCPKCEQPNNIWCTAPVTFYFPHRTAQFKCRDCGRVYTGIEGHYDTESRPMVELNTYTGRKNVK